MAAAHSTWRWVWYDANCVVLPEWWMTFIDNREKYGKSVGSRRQPRGLRPVSHKAPRWDQSYSQHTHLDLWRSWRDKASVITSNISTTFSAASLTVRDHWYRFIVSDNYTLNGTHCHTTLNGLQNADKSETILVGTDNQLQVASAI